jgi:hypothetical protein
MNHFSNSDKIKIKKKLTKSQYRLGVAATRDLCLDGGRCMATPLCFVRGCPCNHAFVQTRVVAAATSVCSDGGGFC